MSERANRPHSSRAMEEALQKMEAAARRIAAKFGSRPARNRTGKWHEPTPILSMLFDRGERPCDVGDPE